MREESVLPGFNHKLCKPRKNEIRIKVEMNLVNCDREKFSTTVLDFTKSVDKRDVKSVIDPFRLQPQGRKRALLDIVERRRSGGCKSDVGPLRRSYDKSDPFIDDSEFDIGNIQARNLIGVRSSDRFRRRLPDYGIVYGKLKFDKNDDYDLDNLEECIDVDDVVGSYHCSGESTDAESANKVGSEEEMASIKQELQQMTNIQEAVRMDIERYLNICARLRAQKSRLWRSNSISNNLVKIDNIVGGLQKPENSPLAEILARATIMKRASLLKRIQRARSSCDQPIDLCSRMSKFKQSLDILMANHQIVDDSKKFRFNGSLRRELKDIVTLKMKSLLQYGDEHAMKSLELFVADEIVVLFRADLRIEPSAVIKMFKADLDEISAENGQAEIKKENSSEMPHVIQDKTQNVRIISTNYQVEDNSRKRTLQQLPPNVSPEPSKRPNNDQSPCRSLLRQQLNPVRRHIITSNSQFIPVRSLQMVPFGQRPQVLNAVSVARNAHQNSPLLRIFSCLRPTTQFGGRIGFNYQRSSNPNNVQPNRPLHRPHGPNASSM
ncbi:hypothetical protein ACOME3_009140 [Neoechinorhynchus agilis]